jgi:hypothetical protein
MDIVQVGAAVAAPAAKVPAAASFGAVMRAHAPRAAQVTSSPAGPAQAALRAIERARERLDAALAEARRGRTFTAQELLALQADAYRYAQTFEVASRLVEHGVQAVKQAVNAQV